MAARPVPGMPASLTPRAGVAQERPPLLVGTARCRNPPSSVFRDSAETIETPLPFVGSRPCRGGGLALRNAQPGADQLFRGERTALTSAAVTWVRLYLYSARTYAPLARKNRCPSSSLRARVSPVGQG